MNFDTFATWVRNAADAHQEETPNYIPRHLLEVASKGGDIPQSQLRGIDEKFFTKKSFTDQLAVLLLDGAEKGQFVLKGDPSTGKSTELRKIARKLQSIATDPQTVNNTLIHLCSIQNYIGDGSNITTSDDLWELIRESHQSEFLRDENMSLDEFLDLHKSGNTNAVLLVDTLDMLTYGVDEQDMEPVSSAWIDLVSRFDASEYLSVLWAVRPVEYSMLLAGSKPPVIEINLPHLDYEEARENVASCLKDYGEIKRELEVNPVFFTEILSAFVQLFPVTARFLNPKDGVQAKRFLTESLLRELDEMFSRVINAEVDFSRDPFDWVLSKASLFTDCIYNVVRDEIFEVALERNPNLSEEKMAQRWHIAFEAPFLKLLAGGGDSKVFSNRFFLDSENSQDEYKNSFIAAGSTRFHGLGIFTQNQFTNRTTFIHQLFIENAVYLAAKNSDKTEATTQKLLSIPTYKLKFFASQGHVCGRLDEAEIGLFKTWFYPLFAYNKTLQLHESEVSDHEHWNSTTDGKNFLHAAKKIHRIIKKSTEKEHKKRLKDLKRLTEDKQDVLDNHAKQIEGPLLVNGPAGTGKTYMAGPFIVERVMSREQHRGKADVSFITLSSNLSKSFQKEFENDYLQDTQDQEPLAAKLTCYSVDELLHKVSVQLECTTASLDQFVKGILTETTFVDRFSRRHMAMATPPYALWQEFIDFFFDREGRKRSLEDYLETIKMPNLGNKSSLFKNNERRAKRFYNACKKAGFTNPHRYRTREMIAQELISKLLQELDHTLPEGGNPVDDSSNEGFIETNRIEWLQDRINHLRFDVMIIDEVQDLGYFVLELCLILHRGEVADVAILGDNEQTLDFVEFEWKTQFERLGTELYTRHERLRIPKWAPDDLFRLQRWKDVNFSRRVEYGIYQLQIVQRSIPPIVYFNKNSFNTSVYRFMPKSTGTASILPGDIAQEKLELSQKKENSIEAGVFWVNQSETMSEADVIENLRRWADSPNLIAVVFPNEAIENHFQILCTEQDIRIETWHPISIKGLEADAVIVFSPWSIETSKFPWYTKGDETKRGLSQWEYIVGEMTSNKTNQITLERIANQRRRHANVMLSRPILSLVIINLDHNLTSGQNGEIDLGLIQAQLPNLEDPSIKYGTNFPLGLGEREPIKELDKESMNEQLAWLSSLINAKKALRQIVSSSGRILRLAGRFGKGHEIELLKGVQFALLPLHVIEEYGDLVFQDQLTAMGSNEDAMVSNDSNHVWVHILERFLFHKKYRTANGMKYQNQNKNFRQKAQKFIDLQTEFYDLSFEIEIGNNKGSVVAFYSQEVGQRIAEAYQKLVSHLAHLDNYFLDDTTTIHNYITSSVFPHIDFGNSLSSWITMARRVKLHSPFLEAENLENLENLDNPEPIDQIIRLVCMFKEEWYEQTYPPSNRGGWKKSLPDNNDPLMEMMSNRRGYLPKDLPKFPEEAVIPYKSFHRKVSSRPDSLPVRDISNIEFWATGVDYLKQDTQEFRESLDKLKMNFLQPLAASKMEEGSSSSAEQIEFLLQLANRIASFPDLNHGDAVDHFTRYLTYLTQFAQPGHLGSPSVSTLARILPSSETRRNAGGHSKTSFIHHILNLTKKQFKPISPLFLSDAFGILNLFQGWVKKESSSRNPLSLKQIYQVAMFRMHLEETLRSLDILGGAVASNPALDDLIEEANIDVDWGLEVGSFDDIRKIESVFLELIKILSPEIDENGALAFFEPLLPAAQAYQNEHDFLPKSFIQHVLGLHRTWHNLGSTTHDKRKNAKLEDITKLLANHSNQPLFKNWTGDDMTELVGSLATQEMYKLELKSDHFSPISSKTSRLGWDFELIEELSFRAKLNKLGVNEKLFDDVKLRSMGVYGFSKEILYNKDAQKLALYGVNHSQANTWSTKLENDPNVENLALNPITQYFVRQIIQDNRHDIGWWDKMFQETDGSGWMSTTQDIVLAERGADSIAIKLSRYFGIVRFSQYIRTHLPEKENLGLSQKKHLDDLVSPANLVGTFLETFRTSPIKTCRDMRPLKRIYEQNLRKQFTSKVGEINFHLDIGLFGSGHPDYPLIVGKTDASRKIHDKNMSDFGFLAALDEIRKQLVKEPKLNNLNSTKLRDLAKTLITPEDNLSIEQLNTSKELRSWTSFSYKDGKEEQT